MIAPLGIASSCMSFVSTVTAYGSALLANLTPQTSSFSEMTIEPSQRLQTLINGLSFVQQSVSETFETVPVLKTVPMQSSLGWIAGIVLVGGAMIGGAILTKRNRPIQNSTIPDPLAGNLLSPIAVPLPQEPRAPEAEALKLNPPELMFPSEPDLALLPGRQAVLNQRTNGYARIITNLEGFIQLKNDFPQETQWKYVLVQLPNNDYELRVVPAYQKYGEENIHPELILPGDRLVGAGYIDNDPERNTLFIDGMSTSFPTLRTEGASRWPALLGTQARAADRIGLNVVEEILSRRFEVKVKEGIPVEIQ